LLNDEGVEVLFVQAKTTLPVYPTFPVADDISLGRRNIVDSGGLFKLDVVLVKKENSNKEFANMVNKTP
jgi:hypothetical protein